jgi:hypothetical protein
MSSTKLRGTLPEQLGSLDDMENLCVRFSRTQC